MFTRIPKLKIFTWILYFIFGLVALGQFERIELPFGSAIYLHELVMAVFILLRLGTLAKKSVKFKSPLILFNLWILVSIVISAISHAPIFTPILYLLRFDLYLVFGWLLIELKLHKQDLFKILVVSTFTIAVLGWLQYFFIPDTRWLMYLGWDNHYLRLISTLFDPGFTGAVLTLGALVIQGRLKNWKSYLVWAIIAGALLLTYSRASFVAYLIGTLILILKEKNWCQLAIIPLFGLGILLLPRQASEGTRLERTASITARVDSLNAVKPVNLSETLFGSGWYRDKNTTTRNMAGSTITSHNSAPDNSFIFVFTALGLMGLGLYLWSLKSVIAAGHYSSLTLAAFGAMSAHAMFSNTLFYPFILIYLGLILALEA